MTTAADISVGTATRGRAHPACFVCAPQHPMGLCLRFTREPDGSVAAPFECDGTYEGYPGMVHGGIVSSLLDGAMTNCLFAQDEIAVTADLHVRFRYPLRLGRRAWVRARMTRACPPLFILAAEVAQDGQVKATAVGKFMRRADSADSAMAGNMGVASAKDEDTVPHNDRRFDPKKCDALVSPERWARWNPPQLLALSGLQPRQTALDLGSGPGFWTMPMAEIVGPAGQVIALDTSRELLDALAARNPPAHVRAVQGELPAIGLPDASVDFIWAAFVFHEVEPPSSLAAEMRRALRPGGRVAILDWRPDAISSGGPHRQHRYLSDQVQDYLTGAGFQGTGEVWRNADAYMVTGK